MQLAPDITPEVFYALHDQPSKWLPLMRELLAEHAPGRELEHGIDGTVLVGIAGDVVLKLYPPFLRDHYEFERAALSRVHGRCSIATPELLATGTRETWPYLVMTRLRGDSLEHRWPSLDEHQRCELLRQVGEILVEVQAIEPGDVQAAEPAWEAFIATQVQGCVTRQQRTGLPAHLLEQVEACVQDYRDSPEDRVLLTGEYTPMNLLVRGARVVGMYDFGDGLVGPGRYDWLGPCCFMGGGRRERIMAFVAGCGADAAALESWRRELMQLLLLHRYSNLRAQVRIDGWERAETLDALALRIWPPA